MPAWQARIIEGFYHFRCPDRKTIREAVWNEDSVSPSVREAIDLHLRKCAPCAYETLPRLSDSEASEAVLLLNLSPENDRWNKMALGIHNPDG